jgi:hypothetical protein
MLIIKENPVNCLQCPSCKKNNVSGASKCEYCDKPIGFVVK